MARNEVFRDATKLSLPVPANTASGAPVRVGGVLNGVTQTKEGEGGNADGYATVWTQGVHTLSVTGTVGSLLTPIYINSSTNALGITATVGHFLFGYAMSLKAAAGAGDVDVLIVNGVIAANPA